MFVFLIYLSAEKPLLLHLLAFLNLSKPDKIFLYPIDAETG